MLHAEIYLLGDVWAIYDLCSYKTALKMLITLSSLSAEHFCWPKVLKEPLLLTFLGFASDPASSS